MTLTGAEIICRILKEQGVRYVFGVPGNTEVPVLHALAQMPEIEYISAIHESVSMAMADGYARASGKVGVVLVHTTPGTANIVGNLFNAHNAGTPLVVIAGKQDSRLSWSSDPTLDSDLLPMVSQYTKACWQVSFAGDVGKALSRAFKEAATPPTGPVFLGVPRDLQSQQVDYHPSHSGEHAVAMDIRADRKALEKAAQLLSAAEQPAILAGHEVPDANAVAELARLAETIAAPVYTISQVSKLIFPTNHPLYYGKAGQTRSTLMEISASADVLLAVGSHVFGAMDYSEGPLLAHGTKLVHIDVDPAGIARYCPTDVALVASPRTALEELADEIQKHLPPDRRQKVRQRFDKLAAVRRETKAARDAEIRKDWDQIPMTPARAISEVASALPKGAVVVDEAIMLSSYISNIMDFSEPGSYFHSNAYLGWGLPVSLGIALAAPGKPVVAIVGDGSALFGLQALWSAARYNIPVIAIVLNNGGYAAIRWGLSAYDKKSVTRHSYDLGDIDFPALCSGFGVRGRRIEKPAEIGPALKEALDLMKPSLLEIVVDPADIGFGRQKLG